MEDHKCRGSPSAPGSDEPKPPLPQPLQPFLWHLQSPVLLDSRRAKTVICGMQGHRSEREGRRERGGRGGPAAEKPLQKIDQGIKIHCCRARRAGFETIQSPCTFYLSSNKLCLLLPPVCLLAQCTPGNEPNCCLPQAPCAGNSFWRPTWASRLTFRLAQIPPGVDDLQQQPNVQRAPVVSSGASAETWFDRPWRAQRCNTLK